ncbi:hypothetical protein VNI00_017143 [Paramarasmius palmivorus]|uniref:Uncharacterized protein n=1 Tax=Paramarasmius palmivorus TaxID=297713 RepID=A0AAW0B7L8_9AGAR
MLKDISQPSTKSKQRNWLVIPEANLYIPQFTPVPDQVLHYPFTDTIHTSINAQLPIQQPEFLSEPAIPSQPSSSQLPTPLSTFQALLSHSQIVLGPPITLANLTDSRAAQEQLAQLRKDVPAHSMWLIQQRKPENEEEKHQKEKERELEQLKLELEATDEVMQLIHQKLESMDHF